MKPGAAWELQLGLFHAEYRKAGEALVFHCHPGTKHVAGRLVYESKGPPDFTGILKSGRMVSFDAKEIGKGTRFPFANLKPHQAAHLAQVHDMGGISFLAIRFREAGLRLILPWSWLRTMIEAGCASALSHEMLSMDDYGWLNWAKGQ